MTAQYKSDGIALAPLNGGWGSNFVKDKMGVWVCLNIENKKFPDKSRQVKST